MADYRGHVVAGAAFYGAALLTDLVVIPIITGRNATFMVENWWDVPAKLAIAVMAALWPDVDITSQARKLYYRLFLAFDAILIIGGHWRAAALLGLVAILPGLGRHRGWTHRFWTAFVLPLPIVILPMCLQDDGRFGATLYLAQIDIGMPFYVAAVVGYLSHLAADGMLGTSLRRAAGLVLWPVRVCLKATEKDHGRL